VTRALPRLAPPRYARTGTLEVAYYEAGRSDGDVTLLLHGFPYDIHSYSEVIPLLAETGRRVIVPYLRGHGPTRFLDPAAPRSGQQAAIGTDVVDLMAALGIPRAILAGFDWGGRAATSRPRTAACPHPTSPALACITRCRAPGTTCPRKPRVPSPAVLELAGPALTAGTAHPTKGTRK
jgi:hypothetical protein